MKPHNEDSMIDGPQHLFVSFGVTSCKMAASSSPTSSCLGLELFKSLSMGSFAFLLCSRTDPKHPTHLPVLIVRLAACFD